MLSRGQARRFYDRFGSRQDWQRLYEDRALGEILAHGDFEKAQNLFELGCGTGRFAEDLLERRLPESATYLGFDLSPTMVALAQRKLARYGRRATVRLTEGSPELPLPDSRFDRFVSNYVLDLLPPEDIRVVLQEAHRILIPGGRLCLVSLTKGFSPLSRMVSWLWSRVHAFRPELVGGCRPVELLDFIPERAWRLVYHRSVAEFGVPSEVIVARSVEI